MKTDQTFGPFFIGRINVMQDSLIALGESMLNKVKSLQVGLGGVHLNEIKFQVGTWTASEVG